MHVLADSEQEHEIALRGLNLSLVLLRLREAGKVLNYILRSIQKESTPELPDRYQSFVCLSVVRRQIRRLG